MPQTEVCVAIFHVTAVLEAWQTDNHQVTCVMLYAAPPSKDVVFVSVGAK